MRAPTVRRGYSRRPEPGSTPISSRRALFTCCLYASGGNADKGAAAAWVSPPRARARRRGEEASSRRKNAAREHQRSDEHATRATVTRTASESEQSSTAAAQLPPASPARYFPPRDLGLAAGDRRQRLLPFLPSSLLPSFLVFSREEHVRPPRRLRVCWGWASASGGEGRRAELERTRRLQSAARRSRRCERALTPAAVQGTNAGPAWRDTRTRSICRSSCS